MSRREQMRTTDSVVSITDSMKSLMSSDLRFAGDLTGIQMLDETSLKAYGPEQFLTRMLSTRSYISTKSSRAEKNALAQEQPELMAFKEVGKGQTGTMYALVGTDKVIKIPNPGKSDGLWNDCRRHKRVEEAFAATPVALRRDIHVPKFGDWVHPSNELFWKEHLAFFPQGAKPDYGLLSTKIYPLPLPVREAMVDNFAPKEVKNSKAAFLGTEANKDCLVRLYLGRRGKRAGTFKLRNFDMMVNEMEYLGLDTEKYATIMAQTLAILHWKAGVDANDVEFVLGSSPTVNMSAALADYENANKDEARFVGQELDFRRRAVGVWLLDFDQCQLFGWNEAGMKQLVKGFFFNDPYYPRPGNTHPKDAALWETFKSQYLEVSATIHTETNLPQRFIEAVEIEGNKRSSAGSLFQ